MFEDIEFLRVKQITLPSGILPISASTWWKGVRSGKFPKPVENTLLGSRMTVWRKKDINQLLTEINANSGD